MIQEIARLSFTASGQTKVVNMASVKARLAHVINGGTAWTGGALRAYGSCDAASASATAGIALGSGAASQPAPKEIILTVTGVTTNDSPWPFLAIVSSGVWAGVAVVVICGEVDR